MAEGKKNRKVGRSKRKPTDQAYKAQDRLTKNKARHVAKQSTWLKLCAKAREAFRKRHPGEPMPRDIGRRVRRLRKGGA